MLFLQRRRSTAPLDDPARDSIAIDHPVPTADLDIRRGRNSSIVNRVSMIFKTRRKGHSTPLSNIAIALSQPAHSRYSSRSSSPLSPDIRRPSGLGRRASSVASARSTTPPTAEWPPTRSLSSPNVYLAGYAVVRHSALRMIEIPTEVLDVVCSFLAPHDLPAVALVSRQFYFVARNALYRSLDLRLLPPARAERLVTLLASRRDLAALVHTLATDTAPGRASLQLSSDDDDDDPCDDDEHTHDDDSQTAETTSSLAAFPCPPSSLRTALGNMPSLTSLTAHFDPAALHHTLPFRLTRLTLLNTALPPLSQAFLLAWLATQPNIQTLALPNLTEAPSPTSSPTTPRSTLSHTFSLPPPPAPPLLPALRTLSAPPGLTALLAASCAHPLAHAAVAIHATLYTGLRPAALMAALRGVDSLTLRFSPAVDRRTLEKVVRAAGGVLGEHGLQTLKLEVGWAGAEVDETVYKIISTVLPRFHALRALRLHRPAGPPEVAEANSPDTLLALYQQERALLACWLRHCPTLREVVFLSGAECRVGEV